MGKFELKLKKYLIEEWGSKYINYYSIKSKILQLKALLESQTTSNNQINHHSNLQFQNQNSTTLKNLYPLLTQGEALELLVDKIHSEVKSLFLFYIAFERKIYVEVNKKLIREAKYLSLSSRDINIELSKLKVILLTIKNFAIFFKTNFLAVKKILIKFNYFLSEFYGDVGVLILRDLLSKNSDLQYMMGMKIVVEVVVLVDYLKTGLIVQVNNSMGDLNLKVDEKVYLDKIENMTNKKENKDLSEKVNYSEIVKTKFEDSVNENQRSFTDNAENTDTENNNNDIDNCEFKDKDLKLTQSNNYQLLDGLKNTEYLKAIRVLEVDIINLIEENDILLEEIRQITEDWGLILDQENQDNIQNNNPKFNFSRKNTFPQEISHFKRLFTSKSQSVYSKSSHNMQAIVTDKGKVILSPQNTSSSKIFTTKNTINIILCLIHTFTYKFLYLSATPTNSSYLKEMGMDSSMTGIVLAATPIASIFSTFLFSFVSNHTYKKPLVFTVFCFFLGSLLYALAFHFKSFAMCFLGRFILGFGGGRIICRRYIIDYVPISMATVFSVYYVLASSLGVAFGPLASIFLSMVNESEYGWLAFNQLTMPGWMGSVWSFLLLCAFIFLFTETIDNKKFSKYVDGFDSDKVNINENIKNAERKESWATEKSFITTNTVNTDNTLANLNQPLLNSDIHVNINSLKSETDQLVKSYPPITKQSLLLNLNLKLNELNNQLTTVDLFKSKLNLQSNPKISFNHIAYTFYILSYCLIIERVRF